MCLVSNRELSLIKLTKLTKLNCPRSCCHRKELLAQLGPRARKYSSCGTFSSRHASSFRKARIKIIICYGKSIRAAIALSIHTIGLTENSLQEKSSAPSSFAHNVPFWERTILAYERSTKVRVSRCLRSLLVVCSKNRKHER